MKRLFLILATAIITTSISAIPAKRGMWETIKLTDGTEVKAELRGDEFCSYRRSEDGRIFTRDADTGLYKAADMETLEAKAARRRNTAQTARAARAKRMYAASGTAGTLYTGTKKGLIILVDFADTKFDEKHDIELYKRIANEEGFTNDMGFRGSVRDYFKAQSLGQFDLQFDVLGPVTMPEGYAYYGAHTDGSEDNNEAVAQMVIDACKAVDSQVDFNDYDWDGDGEADQVFILYAGHGEASYSRDPNTIWPHEWDLYSALYPNYQYVKLDGVIINTYACSCELGSGINIDGIGTICHEFSHCLGLPDMYDTQGSNYGMDLWDLMDYGNYNDDGFCPPNYTSYERMYAGWSQPIELTNDQEVTGMEAIGDGGNTYIIYNDGHRDEYYMLENRQQKDWDEALPNSGLLILHVDYDADAWYNNTVNSSSPQRCTIFHADNETLRKSASLANDIYPYGDNNSLTSTSVPAAIVNNKNTDGTYYMNKSVTEITRHDDGTVSFRFQNLNGSNSIKSISAGETAGNSRIFSIDGRYIGNDIDNLNKGIYIINGRKVVK